MILQQTAAKATAAVARVVVVARLDAAAKHASEHAAGKAAADLHASQLRGVGVGGGASSAKPMTTREHRRLHARCGSVAVARADTASGAAAVAVAPTEVVEAADAAAGAATAASRGGGETAAPMAGVRRRDEEDPELVQRAAAAFFGDRANVELGRLSEILCRTLRNLCFAPEVCDRSRRSH